MWEVIDLVYLEDEGNVVFQGTQEECNRWVAEQEDACTYQVVPVINNYIAQLDRAAGCAEGRRFESCFTSKIKN